MSLIVSTSASTILKACGNGWIRTTDLRLWCSPIKLRIYLRELTLNPQPHTVLYPLSYGRIVFGAQCTIANYSITASFLQVLYWVDEIKNIIKKQEVQ